MTKPDLMSPIDTEAELADMGEEGKEAYRRHHRTTLITHGLMTTMAVVGIVGTIWIGELAYTPVFLLVAIIGVAKLSSDSPDTGALAAARLADDDGPPEKLSWEEHVKKYGHKDGEPLTDEEEEALIDGRVDDSEWRAEHLDDDSSNSQ